MAITVAERNAQASAEAVAIFTRMAEEDPTIRQLLNNLYGPSWRYYGPAWNKLKHSDKLYAYSISKTRHNGRVGYGSWVYRVQGKSLVMMSGRRIHRLRKDAKLRAKKQYEGKRLLLDPGKEGKGR